ncbi:hypothetical protein [Dechloromonas sp. H13]|uniref:hypothetical protein n=1 Tax=Dechloromonas sp. H13 TaxID=2570193 RepID=UPI001290F144|nr:hypothetical protein [Dechloromonas sp. H13]
MSNLRDVIQEAIRSRELGEIFTSDQVKGYISSKEHLNDRYTLKHIGTILANFSVGPGERRGNSVTTPNDALFIRLNRGHYSLNCDDYEDDGDELASALLEGREFRSSKQPNANSTARDIALKMVDYLRNRPFRYLKKGLGRSSDYWVPSIPVVGWQPRLDAYEWNGDNWNETKSILKDFEDRLESMLASTVISADSALKIYDDIRKWGNPNGTRRNGDEIVAHLEALRNGEITEVDSTLTKVYALARPEEYVIYDSRVAAAILTAAEYMYPMRTKDKTSVDTVEVFRNEFSALGVYGGMGGTRPRGYRYKNWPVAYRVIQAQIDANRLCKEIKTILNDKKEGGRDTWTLREVEAVLFMEGY